MGWAEALVLVTEGAATNRGISYGSVQLHIQYSGLPMPDVSIFCLSSFFSHGPYRARPRPARAATCAFLFPSCSVEHSILRLHYRRLALFLAVVGRCCMRRGHGGDARLFVRHVEAGAKKQPLPWSAPPLQLEARPRSEGPRVIVGFDVESQGRTNQTDIIPLLGSR
jgi:hypothetical protein